MWDRDKDARKGIDFEKGVIVGKLPGQGDAKKATGKVVVCGSNCRLPTPWARSSELLRPRI